VDRDFYQIDHNLFAPAVLMVKSGTTGRSFEAGEVNPKVLTETLGFS
jgi:methenyltetrahydromethanopterin cyclohydrolase